MSKVKTISTYNGSAWGTEYPIGADAINVDITNATTNPSDSNTEISTIADSDVTVSNGDTDATAWTKYNKLRNRIVSVLNNLPTGSSSGEQIYFTDVSDLNLTAGNATIATTWAAMPDCTVAYLSHSQLASNQKPATYGQYLFLKIATSGTILFFEDGGTTYKTNIYRMSINSSGSPTGEWMYLSQTNFIPVASTIINTDTTLTTNMMGKLLVLGSNYSENLVLTINSDVVNSLPQGAEIFLFSDSRPNYTAQVKFMNVAIGGSAFGWAAANSTNGVYITIPRRYSIIKLKKMWDANVLIIDGNVRLSNTLSTSGSVAFDLTLTGGSSAWQNYSQTVFNSNLLTGNYWYSVSPTPTDYVNCSTYGVRSGTVITNGQVIFYCQDIPPSNLTVHVVRTPLEV